MLLKISYYGDPILRKKALPVEEINAEIKQLVADMIETMPYKDRPGGPGIGLAAPQVGRSLAIFITCVPLEKEDGSWEEGILRVFINPKILKISDEKWSYSEGCISIPTIRGEVVRPLIITVESTDLDGNRTTQEYTGLEARCILHENDHINGVLFIDRMEREGRHAIENQLREVKKRFYTETDK